LVRLYSKKMKVIVFLSLWAFAWSVPLRGGVFQPTNLWGLEQSGQGISQLWQQQNLVSPKELGQQNYQTQQISELLNLGNQQNVVLQQQGINSWEQGTQLTVAQQIAQLIVRQIQEKKQTLIQNAIQQLHQQLPQLQQSNVIQLQPVTRQIQQVEIIAAIQQLQQIQGLVSRQGSQSLLVQTLKVAIEAQLVLNTVENQQVREIVNTPVQNTEVFQVMVQQLINQITLQDVQVEISRQELSVQQLQQQQQFLNRQRQQIQTEKLIVVQQRQSQQLIQQLQQVQQNLQQQEQQLVQQQLVRQLVIRQLQQVLIDLQNELQQITLNGQIKEQVSQVPWSQVGSLQVGNILNQLPQSQVANLLASGPRGLRMDTNTFRPVIRSDKVTMFDLSQ